MGSNSLVLAVDIGTTNIKAGIVDEDGSILRLTQKELTVDKDETGKAEHDPDSLFKAFIDVCREVSLGFEDRISILVPSTYQFGLLPVDADFRPLTGMMTLLDTRPQESYPELLDLFDVHKLYNLTGCPPLFQYPFSKIYWIKTRRPDIFNKTRYFLGSKDFLLAKLLGMPYTEASLGASTSLMNIRTLQWDSYPLGLLGIDSDYLAPVVPSEQELCILPSQTAELLGLKGGVRLVPGVYDGGAVGIGLGGMEPGVGIINLGTTAMLRVAEPGPVLDGNPLMRLQTCYLADGRWFPGGGVNNAGVVLKWLRDNIFGMSYDELIAESQTVSDSADLYFLPFLSGERNPQIGNAASGVFFGLRTYHKKGHMIRAALEGISFMLRMILESLNDNNLHMQNIRVGGGGSRSKVWMEILASVLDVPLQVAAVDEPALVGSAIIGYTASGRYGSFSEATAAMVTLANIYTPVESNAERSRNEYGFFKYLINNIGEAYKEHNRRGV